MVINFLHYVEIRKAHQAALENAVQAEREAECERRMHLEFFLTDLLIDLEAA